MSNNINYYVYYNFDNMYSCILNETFKTDWNSMIIQYIDQNKL